MDMKLLKQEVEKIAKLSRLELDSKEKELYAKQLSKVLDYVEKLNEVDTENVDITAQVTGLKNVYRNDKMDQCDLQKELVKQATEWEDDLIKTKSVF
jgi:aspartyl-tRNA(Asn)/glutamyl-tRNA(Gln) amidotransferase subunit C